MCLATDRRKVKTVLSAPKLRKGSRLHHLVREVANVSLTVNDAVPVDDSDPEHLPGERYRDHAQEEEHKKPRVSDKNVSNDHDCASPRGNGQTTNDESQIESSVFTRFSSVELSDKLPQKFPSKLFEMLEAIEDDGYADVISWLPHGRAFKIHKQDEFATVVLPKYFRLTKPTSFRRQLNLYGFSRLTGKSPDKGAYYHELFLRGKSFLSRKIVRTRVKGTKVRSPSCPEKEPNFYAMTPLPERKRESDEGKKSCDSNECNVEGECKPRQSNRPTPKVEMVCPKIEPSFYSMPPIPDRTRAEKGKKICDSNKRNDEDQCKLCQSNRPTPTVEMGEKDMILIGGTPRHYLDVFDEYFQSHKHDVSANNDCSESTSLDYLCPMTSVVSTSSGSSESVSSSSDESLGSSISSENSFDEQNIVIGETLSGSESLLTAKAIDMGSSAAATVSKSRTSSGVNQNESDMKPEALRSADKLSPEILFFLHSVLA